MAALVRLTGIHEGEFGGIPATGGAVVMEAVDVCRTGPDGRFIEHWGYADNLAMLQQLGVMPE